MAKPPQTEAEQHLYAEGQIAGLRLILADMLREIDPNGDLERRVRDRLVLHRQDLSETLPPEDLKKPVVSGTLDIFDVFVHLLDLGKS